MLRLMFDVNRPGNRLEQVPRCTYDFITILNNSRFDFTLYHGNSTRTVDIIGNCPAYTILTFPHEKLADTVNFVWAGGGGGVETVASERCKVFFTAENLGLVGQFRAPELAPDPSPRTIIPAISPIIFNIPMPLANTEYVQWIPRNTVKFTLSLRENDAPIRLAFFSTHVAAPSPPFFTIPIGGVYWEDLIRTSTGIFVACPVANRTVQLITWIATPF